MGLWNLKLSRNGQRYLKSTVDVYNATNRARRWERKHIVNRCAPRIMSTNHVMKEEVESQMWGTMIPSTRETNTLLVKLEE